MKDLFETLNFGDEQVAKRKRKRKSSISSFSNEYEERTSGMALREAMGGDDFLDDSKSWLDLDRAIASGNKVKKAFDDIDDELEIYRDNHDEDNFVLED